MQVTVEGVVKSDVCEQGQRLVVEYTPLVKTLTRNGLVKVVDWNHPTVEAEPEIVDDEPEVVEPVKRTRRRMTGDDDG